MKIHIQDLNELYTAITDDQNEGKTLVLATGTYTLSENIDTMNPGRLELLRDITLRGQPTFPPGKSPVPPLPPGTNHTLVIQFQGISKNVTHKITDSYPAEPVRTNKVTLIS